jgi:hypothetical protein
MRPAEHATDGRVTVAAALSDALAHVCVAAAAVAPLDEALAERLERHAREIELELARARRKHGDAGATS